MKYLTAFILIFLVFSCGKSDTKSKGINESSEINEASTNKNLIIVTKAQFQGENMKLASAQELPFPNYIKTTGIIDVPPNSKAIISAYIGGYIKNSPLLIGDKVKKGQALLTIENLEFIQMQQDYIEIAEQLSYLRSEYERQKELYSENISSKKSFLKAESDYKKTSAMYNGLRKKLQMLNISPTSVEEGNLTSISSIYAPISGSITDIGVSTGSYVSPADKIMEIVNVDHIHLELKVFEKDVLKIKKGQKVIFRIPESTNESFEGDIHLIGKSIDKNRTVQVHAHIDHDEKHNFIVGMFVESDILIEDNTSRGLPESAIIDINDKNYVLILKSEDKESYTFLKKELLIGENYNGFNKIIENSSILDTDQFLLGGYNLITEE
jgi:cobalt-zinc-cadmium efflux system membrane fusion protein